MLKALRNLVSPNFESSHNNQRL